MSAQDRDVLSDALQDGLHIFNNKPLTPPRDLSPEPKPPPPIRPAPTPPNTPQPPNPQPAPQPPPDRPKINGDRDGTPKADDDLYTKDIPHPKGYDAEAEQKAREERTKDVVNFYDEARVEREAYQSKPANARREKRRRASFPEHAMTPNGKKVLYKDGRLIYVNPLNGAIETMTCEEYENKPDDRSDATASNGSNWTQASWRSDSTAPTPPDLLNGGVPEDFGYALRRFHRNQRPPGWNDHEYRSSFRGGLYVTNPDPDSDVEEGIREQEELLRSYKDIQKMQKDNEFMEEQQMLLAQFSKGTKDNELPSYEEAVEEKKD